jgi:hypothetical protein
LLGAPVGDLRGGKRGPVVEREDHGHEEKEACLLRDEVEKTIGKRSGAKGYTGLGPKDGLERRWTGRRKARGKRDGPGEVRDLLNEKMREGFIIDMRGNKIFRFIK